MIKKKKLCDTFQNFVNLQLISLTGLNTTLYIYVCNIIKTILFDSILKLSREKGGKEENETRVKFSLTKLLATGQQYVEYIRWRAKFDRETGSIREGSLI